MNANNLLFKTIVSLAVFFLSIYTCEANDMVANNNVPRTIETVDYASWLTAITTVIYTLGTFLLWNITRKTLSLSKNQFERNEKVLQSASFQSIFKNFRDLYTAILQDNYYASILAEEEKTSIIELRRSYLAIFLINHVYEIYLLAKRDLVPPELWEALIIDIRELFKWRFIGDKWDAIKEFHTKDFQLFISEILEPKTSG